jgi:uncharacterized protein (DUF2336 family)
MFSFFKKLFSGNQAERYEEQKKLLESGNPQALMRLAKDADTNPEILYYLASKGDAAIRQAVAANKSTPMQAAHLLAQDQELDVRLTLAARLLKLLPGLSPDKHSQLYAFAVQALGRLAEDEVIQVRQALTSVLQDYAKAPPVVVSRLARDVEREVAEPVLRFCVTLPDEDLLDIIGSHPAPWAVAAIATRESVSARVSGAVIDVDDEPASTALINNPGAAFDVDTLQKIVDQARNRPAWHRPIALRPELSLDLARQMVGFVDKVVLDVLEKRSDFDAATREALLTTIKRRLSFLHDGDAHETSEKKVARFIQEGRMSPDVISDALSWQEIDFVTAALSHASGVHPARVTAMLNAGTAKPVVALCHQAKLPMRVCIEVQQRAAKVKPRDIMYAKGGTDYPLTPDEIKWQLEFFGAEKAG